MPEGGYPGDSTTELSTPPEIRLEHLNIGWEIRYFF